MNPRIRDELWGIVIEMVGNGRALMVFNARNEQGMEIRNHGHAWEPVDFEGVTLMRRPAANLVTEEKPKDRVSRAARYRRIRKK
ncbi:CRISPR-associated protein Cas2 [Raineyella antarctica]|uniref:CRISPR-associated protein Cas2 n=1 Tax=Raineyella antarctica TaxID=1577474 RepID=A0A1G6H886_9ACTN|nr:CRISPR-associated protein Cas2 [Raineyella antarctica]